MFATPPVRSRSRWRIRRTHAHPAADVPNNDSAALLRVRAAVDRHLSPGVRQRLAAAQAERHLDPRFDP